MLERLRFIAIVAVLTGLAGGSLTWLLNPAAFSPQWAVLSALVGLGTTTSTAVVLAGLALLRPSRLWAIACSGLMLITLLGSGFAPRAEMAADARGGTANAAEAQRRSDDLCRAHGRPPEDCRRVVHENGPRYWAWVVPLLPFVSVLGQGYSVGPLWGSGSTTVVFWYGWGSQTLATVGGWIS